MVARGTQINVKLPDRRECKAKLVGLDAVADVALLRIDASGLPTVRIGDPASVEPGDGVVAIGSPYGFGNSAFTMSFACVRVMRHSFVYRGIWIDVVLHEQEGRCL